MTDTQEENFSLSLDEFFAFSRRLEQHHAIFYQFWELGKPCFTRTVKTAAVAFNRQGNCIAFLFNPDFWTGLTDVQREAVVSHECLHILLKHGVRGKDTQNRHAANVAMDVVINHSLVDSFGFSRSDFDPDSSYCWIDTVYRDGRDSDGNAIQRGQSFEYYYNRIPVGDMPMLMDSHEFLFDGDSDELDDFIERVASRLMPDEVDRLKSQLAGTELCGDWLEVGTKPPKPKRKWETVIKKWSLARLADAERTYDHWLAFNRRTSLMKSDLVLPSDMEVAEKEDKGKIEVDFYLDTSGSCVSLAPRFWAAANSLPADRFNVNLFCFNTRIHPVSDEDRQKGRVKGGGTSFSVIEANIRERHKGKKYPDAVFVITDGAGNSVEPKRPERWHWFLTDEYTRYVPKGSNVHLLKDFE